VFGRRRSLDAADRAALAGVVGDPLLELIPLRNVEHQARFLPPGALVSVTASPAKGMDPTIALAESLAARGFRVVPHLSAHMVRDRAHLVEIVRRLEGCGIERVFVVGGDAEMPGEYRDGLALLRAMAELGHRFSEVGIPCYPQGHPLIADDVLLTALRAKAELATSMTTQLCFDAKAIASWIAARRAEGLALPAVIGVPGVVEPHGLVAISARIGVKDTRRFIVKNSSFVLRMVRSGGFYKPDGLLEELAKLFADPDADATGIHLYTFNQVEATEAWRRPYLESLTMARSA
jgi:methylenetetrahydrofolate reductase (NADPH)